MEPIRPAVKRPMGNEHDVPQTVAAALLGADRHYSMHEVASALTALGRCRRSRSSLRPP